MKHRYTEPVFVLKRILFYDDLENPNPEKMNELILLNKKQAIITDEGKVCVDVTVLHSLLKTSSISEELKYEKQISKQEAERLLRLAEDEDVFVQEVYQILFEKQFRKVIAK